MTADIAPTSLPEAPHTPRRTPTRALVMRCDECGRSVRRDGYIKIDRATVSKCYEPVGDWEVLEVKRDRVYWHIVHAKCDIDATPSDYRIPTRLLVTNADLLETTAYLLRNQPELIVASNWHGLIGRILYDTQARNERLNTSRRNAHDVAAPKPLSDDAKAKQAERRKRRLEQGLPDPNDPRHGTTNGYTAYGCRCDSCTAAHANDERRRKQPNCNGFESNDAQEQRDGTKNE